MLVLLKKIQAPIIMLILKGLAQNQNFPSDNTLLITTGSGNSFATETRECQITQTPGAVRVRHQISTGSSPHGKVLPMTRANQILCQQLLCVTPSPLHSYSSACYQYYVESPTPRAQKDKLIACVY